MATICPKFGATLLSKNMKNSLPVGSVAQKCLCLSSLWGRVGDNGNQHREWAGFVIERLIIFPNGNRPIVLAKFKDWYCPWQETERGAIWQLPQISIFACPCISHSGKFGAIWTHVITWCFFCFCFSGVKLNLLNKEVYGYMIQPSGASKTLKDMRISFTHIKLEWFGKSGRL